MKRLPILGFAVLSLSFVLAFTGCGVTGISAGAGSDSDQVSADHSPGEETGIEEPLCPEEPGPAVTVAVSGGLMHTVALRSDGTVWAWGKNDYGQLGDGIPIIYGWPEEYLLSGDIRDAYRWELDRSNPVRVQGLSGVVAISAAMGDYTLALQEDGTVWAWGMNGGGTLGQGGFDRLASSSVPLQVQGLSQVIAVSGGYAHNLALKQDGTVWAWGWNAYGQLGDGTLENRALPVRVTGLEGVVAISAGKEFSLALGGDGTVWSWGVNYQGQLGDGLPINPSTSVWSNLHTTPIQVQGLSGVTAIAAGYGQSAALAEGGTVWTWGGNPFGALGGGTEDIEGRRSIPQPLAGVVGATQIAMGQSHGLALGEGGIIWGWGDNSAGTVGDGTRVNRPSPVSITLPGVVSIASGYGHTLAVMEDGTVQAWGLGLHGQLGDGCVPAFGVGGNIRAVPGPVVNADGSVF